MELTVGDPSRADNIYVAEKTAAVTKIAIDDVAYLVSHGGSSASSAHCICNSSQYVWELSFAFAPDTYDYWLLGWRNDTGTNPKYFLTDNRSTDCTVGSGLCNTGSPYTNFFSGGDTIRKIQLNESDTITGTTLEANKDYYIYINPVGNPDDFMDFYVLRVPKGTAESNITIDNTLVLSTSLVRLRIWTEE